MSNVLAQLHTLGWKVRTSQEQSWAIHNFQRAMGLAVDGVAGPITHAALDKVVANGGYASAHFKLIEFQCHCRQTLAGCQGILINHEVIDALEKTREAFYPSGLSVVSGYRCKLHNRAVGGATQSRHLGGDAIDVPGKVSAAKMASIKTWVGIGYAPHDGQVIHVDHRPGSGSNPVIFPDGR